MHDLRGIGVLMGVAAMSVARGAGPGGPIEYSGMKIAVSRAGVEARGYRFDGRCAKPAPWKGRWIWAADGEAEVGRFRKELMLGVAPERVQAWLTADRKYRLWVNGRLVSRGPVDIGVDYAGGQTHRWFYDCRDLTPFFRKGRNVVAAEVYRDWPIGFTVTRGAPGFLFEALVSTPKRGKRTLATDETWRAMAAPVEPDGLLDPLFTGPEGWQDPAFDDSSWAAARVVKDVWEPLVPSEIPPLMEARYPVERIEGLPQGRVFNGDGSFRVVFDRVLTAYPVLKVRGGKGSTVKISATRTAAFRLAGGEQTLEFPFMDEIAPAYTVELTNVKDSVEIVDAGAAFTSQPVEYRGEFQCSDEGLNRLWQVSRWAVQICLQTHHLDSPNHQEPISDPGDYVIEAMVNDCAFGLPWLTRQDVRKFAWLLKDERYHNFHTSYSIAWLQMLLDYYDFTGDGALMKEMAPYVHELMDTYASWRGANGILSEAPNYMFMDWVEIGGFECHHPPAVIGQGYLTALFYHGLDMASRVAALTGDRGRVAEYAKLRREIAEAFNRELWVPEKGLYRDGKPFVTHVKPHDWLPADKEIETFSPHVNLLAVLYDLAPASRHPGIVEKLMAQGPLNVQPWFMHLVFQAIDHAGLFDKYGVAQMRRWQVVPETQSFHEMWNGGDLSHGWCSTPLVQLSSRVLGVAPASPGFKTVVIRPQACGLAWAKGKVPTPYGDVRVSWRVVGGRLQVDVTLPPGTEGDLVFPGRTVHVGAGRHRVQAAGSV
jgi:hypothetical protein